MNHLHRNYYESAEGEILAPRRVLRELRSHGLDQDSIDEFFREFGCRPEYDAQEVLAWLGY